MNSQSSQPLAQSRPKHLLSAITIATLLAFCGYAAIDLDNASYLTFLLRDLVTGFFDGFLIITAGLVLLLAIGLVFHPVARTVLGADNEKPEFSRWSWFAMLFSAGLGPGLLYWGTAEPVTHFMDNPFFELTGTTAASSGATIPAVVITIFHWGLHGWGMYVIAGLAIAIGAYRFEKPITFSTAFIPLLGEEKINGRTGTTIDLIALYGTIFGVATSIGLSVSAINATMEPLIGVTFSLNNQIGFVALACLLGILSVISGVTRGIRRISEVNIWISLVFMLVIFLIGPSILLATTIGEALFTYIAAAIPMGFWIASSESGKAWQAGWTVFYWGWWFAWTPLIGLFVARISRGRTIREFILGVLLVPTIVVVVWMSVFGGSAISQELNATGAVSIAAETNYSLVLVKTIANLPYPAIHPILLIIVSFLLFTWLITSLDSATLVICHILNYDLMMNMKIFWGVMLGAVTCALMLIGGVEALQAASIIVGLPVAALMLLIIASLIRWVIAQSKPQADLVQQEGA